MIPVEQPAGFALDFCGHRMKDEHGWRVFCDQKPGHETPHGATNHADVFVPMGDGRLMDDNDA